MVHVVKKMAQQVYSGTGIKENISVSVKEANRASVKARAPKPDKLDNTLKLEIFVEVFSEYFKFIVARG